MHYQSDDSRYCFDALSWCKFLRIPRRDTGWGGLGWGRRKQLLFNLKQCSSGSVTGRKIDTKPFTPGSASHISILNQLLALDAASGYVRDMWKDYSVLGIFLLYCVLWSRKSASLLFSMSLLRLRSITDSRGHNTPVAPKPRTRNLSLNKMQNILFFVIFLSNILS